jgi:twitching motility protein PilT
MPSHAVKNFIRNRDFFKITSSVETGADHGMWTFQRYRNWLDSKKNWFIPGQSPEPAESEAAEDTPAAPAMAPLTSKPKSTSTPETSPRLGLKLPGARPPTTTIEIEPDESEFGRILKRPGEK